MRTSHVITVAMSAFLMGACPVCPKGGDDKPDPSGPDPMGESSTTNSIKAIPGGCQTTSGPDCVTTGVGGSGSTGGDETTGAPTAPTTSAAPMPPTAPAP